MVEYDPFSGTAMADPTAIYRELRDSSPVHRLERYDAWVLSRFEDVWQVLQVELVLTLMVLKRVCPFCAFPRSVEPLTSMLV